jgi:phosphoglycerate dehydrogenase-like enzyme
VTERIPRKVAVTSRSFSRHPELVAELRSRFPDARLNPGESLYGENLVEFLRGHDAAIVALDRIDATLLAAVPELRVISKYGVGLDGIDIEAIERRGVMLGWTPGVNRVSVSELTLSAMIALLHRVPEASREVSAGMWRQIRGRELTGRTVGIIGCGHVGKEVARLCRIFQCRVLVYDIRSYDEFYREHSITPVTFGRLLEEAEVVTMHVPLDRSTTNLLNAEEVGRIRDGAVFLNMARGGIVDEAAIKARLIAGTLGGAAFDVFANEPSIDSELVKLPTVLVTPHIGGSSEEAILAMGRAAIEGLLMARPVSSWREDGRIS